MNVIFDEVTANVPPSGSGSSAQADADVSVASTTSANEQRAELRTQLRRLAKRQARLRAT